MNKSIEIDDYINFMTEDNNLEEFVFIVELSLEVERHFKYELKLNDNIN